MPDESPAENQLEPVVLRQDTSTEADHDPEVLTEAQRSTLVRLIRVAYPHPDFPDSPYQRAAEAVQEAVGPLAEGLDQLDAEAGGPFVELGDDEATAVLERLADSDFFGLVHGTVIVALYDDHEVWELLGYEGPSFDKGGYLDRGFDDLDWLPRPRIEEYTAEQRVEVVRAVGGDH